VPELSEPIQFREAVKKAIEEFGEDIACVIIETIPANNGLLLQKKLEIS